MKPNPWLYPALAALAVGGWICYERNASAVVQEEITVVKKRIQQARAAEDGAEKSRIAGEKDRKDKENRIDWKKTATVFSSMRSGGMPDMNTMMKLQKVLSEMSAADLLAQIDEIEALGLGKDESFQLLSMIVERLAEKDPQAALDRFSDQLGSDGGRITWSLTRAFNQWAGKDPAAAIAWFDGKIADGTFDSKKLDGKSESRATFENQIMQALLGTDPQKVAARIAALPEEQRKDVFTNGWYSPMKPENDAAYIQLVRGSLNEKEASQTLVSFVDHINTEEDYTRVNGFIKSASPTDDEKNAIVGKVLENQLQRISDEKSLTETVEKARTWAATQSPGTVDEATGKALGKMDTEQALPTALHYQETTGSDAVLVAYMMNGGTKDKTLIDKIKDPAQRETVASSNRYKNKD